MCCFNDSFYCGVCSTYYPGILYFFHCACVHLRPSQRRKCSCYKSRAALYIEWFLCLLFKTMVVMTDSDWFILRIMRIFMSNLLFCFQLYHLHTLFKVYPDWQGRPKASISACLSSLPWAHRLVGSAIGLSGYHREIARTLKRCSCHNWHMNVKLLSASFVKWLLVEQRSFWAVIKHKCNLILNSTQPSSRIVKRCLRWLKKKTPKNPNI